MFASSYLLRQKNKAVQGWIAINLSCQPGCLDKAVRPWAEGRPMRRAAEGQCGAVAVATRDGWKKRTIRSGTGKAPGGPTCPCQRCDRFLQPGQMRNDPDSLSSFAFFLAPPSSPAQIPLVSPPSSGLRDMRATYLSPDSHPSSNAHKRFATTTV